MAILGLLLDFTAADDEPTASFPCVRLITSPIPKLTKISSAVILDKNDEDVLSAEE